MSVRSFNGAVDSDYISLPYFFTGSKEDTFVQKLWVSVQGDPNRHEQPNFEVTNQNLGRLGTWENDFVFDVKFGKEIQAEVDPNRVLADYAPIGSFVISNDLLLRSEAPGNETLETTLSDWAHFASGYRKRNGDGARLEIEGRQFLARTEGRAFLAKTHQGITTRTWAYKDDRFSLYFIPHNSRYRVLPEGQDWLFRGLNRLPTQGQSSLQLETLPSPGTGGTVAIPLDTSALSGVHTDKKLSASSLEPAFDHALPASPYDWEVFFHAPLLIASQLSKAQRFSEAQRWFHTIFDPTTNASVVPGDEATRYWRFEFFRKEGRGEGIDQILEEISQGDTSYNDAIAAWKDNPFNPHLVARFRPRSYQWVVVIKYIENLIAWGDQLFRRDTIETINEATQLYVLAAHLLGPRPHSVPKADPTARTYRQLAGNLDGFSNVWESFEDLITTYLVTLDGSVTEVQYPNLTSIGLGSLYFCVPRNESTERLWDLVEERLRNIRNCRNIEGIARPLALFEPPIDPALLVRATAAGLDLDSVLNDIAAPLPYYRFNVMLQKALEICNELRGLGSSLLAALEKRDGEALALLRSGHELDLLKLTVQVKNQQIEEARLSVEGLQESRRTSEERYKYFQQLLGKTNMTLPQGSELTILESITPDHVSDKDLRDAEQGLGITKTEQDQLYRLREAQIFTAIAGLLNVQASLVFAQMNEPIGHMINAIASSFNAMAAHSSAFATRDSIIGGYQRRRDEWIFQSNLAKLEGNQIDKQIVAARKRQEIAEKELSNLNTQIEQARKVDTDMRSKFTNQQLYRWMGGQLSETYFRTFQLARDLAKRAERCLQFELRTNDMSFIGPDYWDGLKQGLQAGERLHLDLKRMESAYFERNKREYELTKHISLRQLDPAALLLFRATGVCEVGLPEWLFDLDGPGHYMRRIKSVSLSIPAVTGPYTTVSCTLTLLKSTLRTSPLLDNGRYEPSADGEDDRFATNFGAVQSIVTSSGTNDSGMFEFGLRDERFLPFEGLGVQSTWRLELPFKFRQFDYDTISDVILHVRYTARQGGTELRDKAVASLTSLVKETETSGLALLLSLSHDFPSEWHRFTAKERKENFVATIQPEHFPYFTQGRDVTIAEDAVQLYTIKAKAVEETTPSGKAVTKLGEKGAYKLELSPGDIGEDGSVFALLRYSVGR